MNDKDYWRNRCVKAEMALISMQAMFSSTVVLPLCQQVSDKVDEYFKDVASPSDKEERK